MFQICMFHNAYRGFIDRWVHTSEINFQSKNSVLTHIHNTANKTHSNKDNKTFFRVNEPTKNQILQL